MDLYVIGEGDGSPVVKIGKALDAHARLKTIQTGHPRLLKVLYVEPGAGLLEGRVHNALRAFHLRGEWFDFRSHDPVRAVRRMLGHWRDTGDPAIAPPFPPRRPRSQRPSKSEREFAERYAGVVEELRAGRQRRRSNRAKAPVTDSCPSRRA